MSVLEQPIHTQKHWPSMCERRACIDSKVIVNTHKKVVLPRTISDELASTKTAAHGLITPLVSVLSRTPEVFFDSGVKMFDGTFDTCQVLFSTQRRPGRESARVIRIGGNRPLMAQYQKLTKEQLQAIVGIGTDLRRLSDRNAILYSAVRGLFGVRDQQRQSSAVDLGHSGSGWFDRMTSLIDSRYNIRRLLGVQRIVTLLGAVLVALSCGTNYVWIPWRFESIFSAYAPQLGARLHVSHTQLNIVGLAGNVGDSVSGPVWGRIVDSRGPRILLAGAFLCSIVGYSGISACMAMAQALEHLSPRLLTGLGANAGVTAAVNTVAKSFPESALGSLRLFFDYCTIFFPGDTSALLLLLSLATSIPPLLAVFIVRPVPLPPIGPGPEGDQTRHYERIPNGEVVPFIADCSASVEEDDRRTLLLHSQSGIESSSALEIGYAGDFYLLFTITLFWPEQVININNVGAISRALIAKSNPKYDETEASNKSRRHSQLESRTSALRMATAILGLAYGSLIGTLPVIIIDWFGLAHLSENMGYVCLALLVGGNFFSIIFGRNLDAHVPREDTNMFLGVTRATNAVSVAAMRDILSERQCLLGRECYVSSLKVTLVACMAALALSAWAALRDEDRKRLRKGMVDGYDEGFWLGPIYTGRQYSLRSAFKQRLQLGLSSERFRVRFRIYQICGLRLVCSHRSSIHCNPPPFGQMTFVTDTRDNVPGLLGARRIITLLGSILVAVCSGTNYIFSAYAPQLGARLHISHTQLNVVGLAGNAGVYVSGPIWGRIVDSRGPRIPLTGAFLCFLVGYSGIKLRLFRGHISIARYNDRLGSFWLWALGVLIFDYCTRFLPRRHISFLTSSPPSLPSMPILLALFIVRPVPLPPTRSGPRDDEHGDYEQIPSGEVVPFIADPNIHTVGVAEEDSRAPLLGSQPQDGSSTLRPGRSHSRSRPDNLPIHGKMLWRNVDFYVVFVIMALYINNVGSISLALFAKSNPNYDEVEASKWQAAQATSSVGY
ncbi:hypothetical protein EDC04DRAFT_2612588 [Pisolithus marmoratus]|nr:hypothetical protein EDC04DRAFT_2612588 [Pisolithus marmoratus]